MKLVPTAISLNCPICKGLGLRELTTSEIIQQGIMISVEAYARGDRPKTLCNCKGGRIIDIVLAPEGWDGKSPIEIPTNIDAYEEIILKGVSKVDIFPKEQDHCMKCKWWDKYDIGSEKRECGIPKEKRKWDCIDQSPLFEKDFCCIHYEIKE
jgi:hypothetical protein